VIQFGIDAASFQRAVNWAQVGRYTRFGWEKVSEGLTYRNPYWPGSKTAMRDLAAAGSFTPGAYLFLEHGDGARQADYFAQFAGDLDGFGLAVDIEPTRWSRPSLADAVACVNRLRVLYPRHPVGGYIPRWYWGDADTTFVDWLWASRYLSGIGTPEHLFPQVPAGWWAGYGGRPVSLLQFTSTAVVSGVSGLVDCSAFRGTPEAYAKMVLPGHAPPPPPPATDWQVTLMRSLPLLVRDSTAHGDVRRAQALLGQAGAPTSIDGLFGVATEIAVKHVQAAHGLHADGQVGQHTWAVLITGADL
jgi:GH25 family lysozyme M1 (1,4-beta-N-acetylmuramidase)